MIKTNTTTKKSTAKKAAPKKTAPKKTTAVAPKKTVAKKTTTVAQKATVAPQKTAPKKTTAKKAPVKKVTTPKISEKIIPAAPVKKTATSTATGKEGVKLLGILHLAGNLLSGGTLGLILVVLYYFFQKNKLSALEKETCFEIINFNLSFIIYAFVASVLIFILIGLLLIPIVLITWLVLMVVGFLKHISGENYKYPFTIRFVS